VGLPEKQWDDPGYGEWRKKYFVRLRLPPEAEGAQAAALARAHDLRRFEIENYWRRATYFWGFQLVAFGALALSAKDGKVYPALALFVAVLGFLTAYAAFLTARGSKFWQQNWEIHVDLLEDEVEGWLHKTVPLKAELAPSVSSVNERLLQLLMAGWIGIFSAASAVLLCPMLLTLSLETAGLVQFAFGLVTLGSGWCWLRRTPRSGISDRTVRLIDFERSP
jgi:hypothetical protein